ncbi:MAG: ABC-three component system protein [Pseudomonadota bacterium]
MDPITLAWYGLHLKAALLEKKEQAYEDFFCKVMIHLHSDNFQPVKAAGQAGDGKSDGYLVPEHRIFQCYAPSTGFNKSKLLKKIKEDFNGAKNNWKDKMRKWTFVHNDPEGLPKYALDLMEELKEENKDVEISVFGPDVFKEIVLSLPVSKLIDLFGPAPTQNEITTLTHDPIKTLLRAMSGRQPDSGVVIAPVSVEKLQFNRLSSDAEFLLMAGRHKENLVNDLLIRWPDPEYGESLAEAFREKYKTLLGMGLRPDDIFLSLKEFAGGSLEGISAQASALAVLSYFFERCDIFENAPEGWVNDIANKAFAS